MFHMDIPLTYLHLHLSLLYHFHLYILTVFELFLGLLLLLKLRLKHFVVILLISHLDLSPKIWAIFVAISSFIIFRDTVGYCSYNISRYTLCEYSLSCCIIDSASFWFNSFTSCLLCISFLRIIVCFYYLYIQKSYHKQ